MKVSPDTVAIPERKAWKNRRLASGIATRLLPGLLDFLVSLAAREGKMEIDGTMFSRECRKT